MLPLGSGALAGSGFPFDREAMARDLGFAAISRNSMDVSADRDFVLDFLYAATTTMLHLSRLAEDWILYSSEEFGWMELGDGVTSGSSLMPQKKNPDSLELIRGKCGRVVGCLNALLVTMKGLPLTYNRDMQEDKEPLFEAADQLSGSLEMARVVVDSVKLNPAVPQAGRRRKLGGGDRPGRGAVARGRAVSPGASDRGPAGARKHPAGQEAVRTGRPTELADVRARVSRRDGAAARSRRRHEIARDSRRHGARGGWQGAGGRPRAPGADARMSKSFRQGQILKLIRAKAISTQDDLAQELKKLGIAATQVTLSRDIRELGLAKTPEGYRQIAPSEAGPTLATLAAEFLLDVRLAQNLVVLEDVAGTRQFGRCGHWMTKSGRR